MFSGNVLCEIGAQVVSSRNNDERSHHDEGPHDEGPHFVMISYRAIYHLMNYGVQEKK
jgi:hypothetical protein